MPGSITLSKLQRPLVHRLLEDRHRHQGYAPEIPFHKEPYASPDEDHGGGENEEGEHEGLGCLVIAVIARVPAVADPAQRLSCTAEPVCTS